MPSQQARERLKDARKAQLQPGSLMHRSVYYDVIIYMGIISIVFTQNKKKQKKKRKGKYVVGSPIMGLREDR